MRKIRENLVLVAVLGLVGLLIRHDTKVRPPKAVDTSPIAAKPSAATEREPHRPGWWTTLKTVGKKISDNGLLTQAAAITFYALLSIFPAMAALVSIYGLVADPSTIVEQLDSLSGVLPGGAQSLLTDQLKSLTSASSHGLGIGVVIGLATSLWTSNQAMKAMFNALNAVHEVREVRGFFKLTAMTLACTLGTILFLVVALAGIVVLPAVLNTIGLSFFAGTLISVLRWPLLLVCVALLLATLYRFGPCRDKVVWRWVSAGSVTSSILWVVVSGLFSWYVANFGSYDKTYGSLGAVVGFMTWIWISGTVVLSGAQLDAELERSAVGQQHPTQGEPVEAV